MKIKNVDLVACGYEWNCPICDMHNLENEVAENVICMRCNNTFDVSNCKYMIKYMIRSNSFKDISEDNSEDNSEDTIGINEQPKKKRDTVGVNEEMANSINEEIVNIKNAAAKTNNVVSEIEKETRYNRKKIKKIEEKVTEKVKEALKVIKEVAEALKVTGETKDKAKFFWGKYSISDRSGFAWDRNEDNVLRDEIDYAIQNIALKHRRSVGTIISRIKQKELIQSNFEKKLYNASIRATIDKAFNEF